MSRIGGASSKKVELENGDIEIGAVEIKNSTDDTRATVGANGLYVDVRASALPTGASTSANQTNGNQKTQVVDSTGADLDLWHTGDIFTAAADHGLEILGVSTETPKKYRPIQVDSDGQLQIDVLTMPTVTIAEPVTVDATDLDIRNLVFATDKVDASGTILGANSGVDIGDVTINNASIAVTGTFWQSTQPVSATNLDIRDLVVGDVVSAEPDGTALGNGQVTVDTTLNGTTILSASAGRQGAVITNQGTVDCYIGTGNVSASNGFLLRGGESISLPTDSEIKGFVASSTTIIGYLSFA